jgi:hypothetical protein
VAFDESATIDWCCNTIEDGWEEVWLQSTNVTQSNGSTRLEVVIKRLWLHLLIWLDKALWLRKEDLEQVIDRLE